MNKRKMGKIDKYKMSKRKNNIKKISGGKAKKKAYSSTKGSHNLNVCQKSKTKQKPSPILYIRKLVVVLFSFFLDNKT